MTPLTLTLRGITKAFHAVVANDRVDLDYAITDEPAVFRLSPFGDEKATVREFLWHHGCASPC